MAQAIEIKEADNYAETSSLENEDGIKLIKLASPQQGGKILDLGCGTGYLSNHLADLVGVNGFVVAVDPDKRRLALAEARYKSSNLKFIQGCAENFPINEYDVIFCNHVLHWVRDRPKVFARMANSLKSGGLLACNYTIEHGNQADKYNFLSSSSRRALSENMSDPLRENECDILTNVLGFHQLHKSQHYCVHNFKDEKEYIKFFLTHWRIEKILEKDVNIEAISNKKTPNGELYFKYPVMTIVMQKI